MNFFGQTTAASFAVALGIATCAGVHAGTFCVSSVTQLSQALTNAQDNGEDDTIYLVVGNYLLSSELFYYAPPDETYHLWILGGMAAGCALPASSGNSVLDGQDAVRIFTISAYGEVQIGRISFQNGGPAQNFGGALNITNASAEDTDLFNSAFVSNETSSGNGGGAVYLSTQGDAFISNNLFIANTSSGGAAMYLNDGGGTYVTGNTIVANQLINHTGTGALDLTGSGNYWISNNILWNNDAYDVFDQSGHAIYANNDVGVRSGTPLSVTNELSVDPDFDGFLSVKLAPESPLVNAGNDIAAGGTGPLDLSGGPRLIGKHVDIGAYETDVLFRNGYQ